MSSALLQKGKAKPELHPGQYNELNSNSDDLKSDRTRIHDRPARLLSIEDRIARIESLVTTYPLNAEAPSKGKYSSPNALTLVIEEQARLDEKGSLHLLKDGETEFIGLSSHSLGRSLTFLLETT